MRLSQAAATGFLLAAVSFAGTAWADPFTWTPTGASPSLNGAPINATNLIVTDFDAINTATGGFNGVLGVLNFQAPNQPNLVPTGYNTNYSLYLTFSGTSDPLTIPTAVGDSTTSTFRSLSYTLWANQGPLPTFSISTGWPDDHGNKLALRPRHRQLGQWGGYSTRRLMASLPPRNVTITLNPAAGEAGFFTSPSPTTFNLQLIGNFGATPSVVGISDGFVLIGGNTANPGVGGGGNLTLTSTRIPTPEPFSLTLLGSGLAGWAWSAGAARRTRGPGSFTCRRRREAPLFLGLSYDGRRPPANQMTESARFSYDLAFARNLGWLNEWEQLALRGKCVAIAGMGGVGGVELLTLARLGIGQFRIADFDRFDIVNFNRQIGATVQTIGRPKAEVLEEMARAINPDLRIRRFDSGIDTANIDQFLEGADLFVDGFDFFVLDIRRRVFARCAELGIPALTAAPIGMGTGYLAFVPDGMSFEQYFRLEGQPENEQYLRFLLGLTPAGLHRSYLVDPSRLDLAGRTGPSTVAGCQLCSGVVAAMALKLLLRRGEVLAAPYHHHFDGYLGQAGRNQASARQRQPLATPQACHRPARLQ